jgi:hypothetical protein
MHGRVKIRVTGVMMLVALAASGCSSGSGSTPVTPSLTAGSGSSANGVSSGTGGTPTSAQASTPSRPSEASPSSSQTPPDQDAIGAVRGYYGAVAAHNAGAAQQFLAPEYLANFGGGKAFAAWVSNYRSLTGLTLRAARAPSGDVPPQHPGYRGLIFVPVSYVAHLRVPSANETNGQQDRFALVGRSATSGKWLIVDIATSP